jgi:hypothetical protein
MGVSEPNQNQGAESTICFLMSLLATLQVAGEGMQSVTAEASVERLA